jgi:hypothetical protein
MRPRAQTVRWQCDSLRVNAALNRLARHLPTMLNPAYAHSSCPSKEQFNGDCQVPWIPPRNRCYRGERPTSGGSW